MNTDDLNKLIELARSVTTGPWTTTHIFAGEEIITGLQTAWKPKYVASVSNAVDAEYIAALAPQIIIQLCEELKRLRASEERSLNKIVELERPEDACS